MINGGNKIIKTHSIKTGFMLQYNWVLSPAVALELGYLNSFQKNKAGGLFE
jgi:hypothetical protein